MQFTTHPEIHEFRLDTGYRGALFAWPVLMNPSRVAIRNWSLDQLGFDRLGESLTDNRFMTHQGQVMTFLASAVDASFVSSARADESSVLRMLVSLQKSLPSVDLARELFRINHFDVAGGGLVFIIGAIYRKASDPRPLFIPDAEEFLVSKERLSMETALGNGEPHSQHQILPAFPLSKAITEGLRMGVQCWGGMHDEPLRCDFDLEPSGGVTFALSTEDRKAVYLRLGHDVISAQDMKVIQDAFLRCSANSAVHQSAYKH